MTFSLVNLSIMGQSKVEMSFHWKNIIIIVVSCIDRKMLSLKLPGDSRIRKTQHLMSYIAWSLLTEYSLSAASARDWGEASWLGELAAQT